MVSIGNAKQVLNLFTRTAGQSFVQRPNIVSVLASDLRYAPQAEGDVFFKVTKQIAETFIKADKKIFSWVKHKHALSMTEVNPESLVMVHRTKYFPKDGKIVSTNMATRNIDGAGECRHTIHFALNKSVTEHFFGNKWNDMKYSIILPFKETVESMPSKKVIGGIQDDFFFLDEVKLPKGSIIVKHNPNIENGIYKVTDIFDGVKLIETSSNDMVKTTDNIITKMGFSTYNEALKKHLKLNNKEFTKVVSQPEAELQQYISIIEQNGIENIRATFKKRIEQMKNEPNLESVKEALNNNLEIYEILNRIKDKMSDFPKAWKSFCNKNNFINKLHSDTPWFTLESTIMNMKIYAKEGEQGFRQELKDLLINDLERAKENIPIGKSFDFDFDAMIKIIKESDAPQKALDRFAKELKLQTSNESMFLL